MLVAELNIASVLADTVAGLCEINICKACRKQMLACGHCVIVLASCTPNLAFQPTAQVWDALYAMLVMNLTCTHTCAEADHRLMAGIPVNKPQQGFLLEALCRCGIFGPCTSSTSATL